MKATKQQLQEWKEKYGQFFELKSEDGKSCFLFDPATSMTIMKQVATAMASSDEEFALSILNNCWIGGDEELRTTDGYLNGFIEELKEILQVKPCTIEFEKELPVLVCEEHRLAVRKPTRDDCINAAKKNRGKEPFETSIALLKLISLDKDAFETLRQKHVPHFLAMLTAVDKLKDKVVVTVKKY